MPARLIAREEGLDGAPVLVAKGDVLFRDGEASTFIYKAVSGCLRTCRFLGDGTRLIDAFHFPGDILGLSFGDAHRVTAEAVGDATLIAYGRQRLHGWRTIDLRLHQQVIGGALAGLERAQNHILLLGRKSTDEKVAVFLLDMSARLARGGDTFTLPMDRVDIANHLGMSTETVSRTLTRFVREALVVVVQKQVTLLDRPRLAALLKQAPPVPVDCAA